MLISYKNIWFNPEFVTSIGIDVSKVADKTIKENNPAQLFIYLNNQTNIKIEEIDVTSRESAYRECSGEIKKLADFINAHIINSKKDEQWLQRQNH